MNNADKVQEILSTFNFEKVHKAMIQMNWVYGGGDGSLQVPTMEELIETAQELLEEIIEWPDEGSMSTGGFFALKTKYTLSIFFAVADKSIRLDGKDYE